MFPDTARIPVFFRSTYTTGRRLDCVRRVIGSPQFNRLFGSSREHSKAILVLSGQWLENQRIPRRILSKSKVLIILQIWRRPTSSSQREFCKTPQKRATSLFLLTTRIRTSPKNRDEASFTSMPAAPYRDDP